MFSTSESFRLYKTWAVFIVVINDRETKMKYKKYIQEKKSFVRPCSSSYNNFFIHHSGLDIYLFYHKARVITIKIYVVTTNKLTECAVVFRSGTHYIVNTYNYRNTNNNNILRVQIRMELHYNIGCIVRWLFGIKTKKKMYFIHRQRTRKKPLLIRKENLFIFQH